MSDIDRWINEVSQDDEGLIRDLKDRYIEIADRYCPDLDENGRKYLTEYELAYQLANVSHGLHYFIQFLEDDETAKDMLKEALARYNHLTENDYKVNDSGKRNE